MPAPGPGGADGGPQPPEQPAEFTDLGSAASDRAASDSAAGDSAVSASDSAAAADAVAEAVSGDGPEDDRVSGGAVFVARLPHVLAWAHDPADTVGAAEGGAV